MLCLTASMAVAGQVSGRVTDMQHKPLSSASVVAVGENNKTIAYCITDDDGCFSIDYPSIAVPQAIVVRYIGFRQKRIAFTDFKAGSDIVLQEEAFKIKEVKVKAQRIRQNRDTLTYSVAGFKQQQDRSIADVIAKMPGLEVKQDGTIAFQGRNINTFYIEGMDLMGSKYSLASSNISANDIKEVQVLQHHQPVKSLRGVSFSESAALNIVLKDEAKNIWTGLLEVGAGVSNDGKYLHDDRLMGMRFDKKAQMLTMYKDNNIGSEIADEVKDLVSLKEIQNEEHGLLSPFSTSSDLPRERYSFNRSHLLATNWLWKLVPEAELRVQANALYEKSEQRNEVITHYWDMSDRPVINENRYTNYRRNEYKAEVCYTLNRDRFYLKNNFKGYIDFNKSEGNILYNNQPKELTVTPRKRFLQNSFQLIKTNGKGNSYEFNSFVSYSQLPEDLLTVTSDAENLRFRFLTTRNYFNYKQRIGKFYIDNKIGLDYYDHSLDSRLVASDASEQSATSRYTMATAYLNPMLSIVRQKFKFYAEAKAMLAKRTYGGTHRTDFWVEPSARFYYDINAFHELKLIYRFYQQPFTLTSLLDYPLYTSYNLQTTHRGKLDERKLQFLQGGYSYANPIRGVFYHLTGFINYGTTNIFYRSSLGEDGIIHRIATDQDYNSLILGSSTRFSKSLGWAKTVLGIGGAFSWNQYKLLIQEAVNDADLFSANVKADYSLRPLEVLSIEGNSGFFFNKQVNRSNQSLSAGISTYYRHQLNANIFPSERWQISVKNTFYHSPTSASSYFCDLFASYRTHCWELSLLCNNIFNTAMYERESVSTNMSSFTRLRLREREIMVKFSLDL